MTPMRRAIAEARRGAGFVSPNPLVGCVILDRAGEVLAVGYHARLGDLHAEAHALSQIKDPARLDGAHVFVTLEPCAHQGRQPSCARALAALPIAAVTYGLDDPNPLVSGRGVQILRDAGKIVTRETGLDDELEELAEIFLLNQRHKRPFVACKVASSLDGQVALANGASQWITGEAARARVQHQRGCYDAVLTGVGTVLADDPRLDARDPMFVGRANRLVLLDPRGRLRETFSNLALTRVRSPDDIVYVTGSGVKAPAGVRHVEVGLDGDGTFDLNEVLAQLMAHQIYSVYVEAGPRTVTAFARAGLIDRLFLFVAPKLLGAGRGWTSGLSFTNLDQVVRLDGLRFEPIGPDWLATAKVQT